MRSSPNVELTLVLLLAAAAETVHAAEGSVTTTTTLEVHGDNFNNSVGDDNYADAIERLNVGVNDGSVSSSARIDTDVFLNRPDPGFQQNIRLERMNLQWSLGDIRVDAGDFFQQLGRGIVLSVRKANEANLDVSLQGARLTIDGEINSLTVFAAQANPANVDGRPAGRRGLVLDGMARSEKSLDVAGAQSVHRLHRIARDRHV